jgi:hypothetical protein
MNLAEAIAQIENICQKRLTSICYEDGSMKKFIVEFIGENKKIFVDLTKSIEAKKIIEKF